MKALVLAHRHLRDQRVALGPRPDPDRGAVSAEAAAVARPLDARSTSRAACRRPSMGLPVLLGHWPSAAGAGHRADLHRAADRAAAGGDASSARRSARSIGGSAIAFAGVLVIVARPGAGRPWPRGLARQRWRSWSRRCCYAINIVMMRAPGAGRRAARDHFLPDLTIADIWLAAIAVPRRSRLAGGAVGLDLGRVRCDVDAGACCSPGPMRAPKRAILR